MLTTISQLLNTEQLDQARSILNKAHFINGKMSAGMKAEQVKNNEELAAGDPAINSLNQIIMNTLVKHPVYLNAALPHRIASPFYARYTQGMHYGFHVDDPVMGPVGQRYRTDVSITVFINNPEDYDGGEIEIRTSFGQRKIKLAAGDAVIYPSSSLHQVTEVTRGERLVAVTWVQSMIRDPAQREILYELGIVREKMLREDPDSEETARIDISYVNLLRMWSEV
ncbi:MAG: Fe2+-dependent dioxygenase [Gammaproteobacteria bacterium]|nr:Fe2+-dependent dioxygenase [Gammaproteobacteria bacterium]